jgi:hypothetical protein
MERLRYFSRTELLKLPKDQDLPVYCREINNCFANDLCCFSASERLERRFAGRYESVEIVERLTEWPAPLPTIGLEYFIDGDTGHPRSKAGL